MESITLAEYNQYLKLVEKHQKHIESVKRYKQTHKNDPSYIEYNRRNAKNYYQRHKEEIKQKYIEKKNNKIIENEITQLMNISAY